MKLTDYIQYYMVLADANSGRPEWKEEYRFTEAYKQADASANSLAAVLESFTEMDGDAFFDYFLRNSVLIADSSNKPADGIYTCGCQCRIVHLCSIRYLDYSAYDDCKIEFKDLCAEVSGVTRQKISLRVVFASFVLFVMSQI